MRWIATVAAALLAGWLLWPRPEPAPPDATPRAPDPAPSSEAPSLVRLKGAAGAKFAAPEGARRGYARLRPRAADQAAKSVRVRVEDWAGNPVSGAPVYCSADKAWVSGRRGMQTTDVDGRAEFTDVIDYEFSITVAWDFGASPRHAPFRQVFHRGKNIVIRLGPPQYIEGHALTPDGDPVAAVVYGSHAGWHEWAAETDAATGAFRLGPLAPGRYRLRARAEHGFLPAECTMQAPASGVKLRLHRRVRFERGMAPADRRLIDVAMWYTPDRATPLTQYADQKVHGDIPAGMGSLYMRDMMGRYLLLRHVELNEVPEAIVPSTEGETISGTVVADLPTDVVFRMREVVIPGDVEFGLDTFEIPGVPPGSRGRVQVLRNGRVLREAPARAGQANLKFRLPDVPTED